MFACSIKTSLLTDECEANMKIYGNNIKPACAYCERGTKISSFEKVTCSKYGVVDDSYSCRKFIYDPTKRMPPKRVALPKFEKSDFSL